MQSGSYHLAQRKETQEQSPETNERIVGGRYKMWGHLDKKQGEFLYCKCIRHYTNITKGNTA